MSLSIRLVDRPVDVVAAQRGELTSAEAFLSKVQSWFDTLQTHHGERWAVYHNDTLEFTAILFALWQLGRTACVPGDSCLGTVQQLMPHVDGFIGEFPINEAISTYKEKNEPVVGSWRVLPTDLVAIEVFTSGSTGDPKPIKKTVGQIEKEVEALEQLWPSKTESVVLATVSHQHFYGMMFRILWPISTGRAFGRNLCEYVEDIFHQAKYCPLFTLVASPSHLGRFGSDLGWSMLETCCHDVISSAAPLSREDSLNISQQLSAPVREIYGSSETGAIAWRSQQSGERDASWRALPSVTLRSLSDGSLFLQSPYLGEDDGFNLPDQVEFNKDGSFKLMGRLDRIVKVEGKRVSLVAIEKLLLFSRWVKNVRALTTERQRVETALVIQLTEEGTSLLQAEGRNFLIKKLKGLLRAHFEPVVLPRRWRFVEHMPYNKQGKLPLDALQVLFEKPVTKWPVISNEKVDDSKATIQCKIPADLVYFDGHFDGAPILPGVVQVHWAEAFGRRLFSIEGSFKRLEVIKFRQIISPNITISVVLKYDQKLNKLTFQYESNKGVHSSGRICFG